MGVKPALPASQYDNARAGSPSSCRRLRGAGLGRIATEELMQRVVQAGADGMTVNFPDKLIAYLNSLS
jgi:glycerophosphoryl diester phosphodiesterase